MRGAASGPPSESRPAFERLGAGGLRGEPREALALLEAAWDELDRWISLALRTLAVPAPQREDVAQEVLLRIWRWRSRYRGGSPAELRAWIFRICQRESARMLGAAARRPHDEPGVGGDEDPLPEIAAAPEGGATSHVLEEAEVQRALAACIERLETAARQVIELLYSVSSLTEREVSVLVGVPKSQVHVLRHRALESLAICLRRQGVDA